MSFVGGSLSLKGGNTGVKKKSKKGKDGKKSKPDKDGATAPALADDVPEQAKKTKPTAAPTERRTKAQIQHEEYVAKREAAALKKAGVKSHRQRISEYNEKLSLMTEHNDIPKVGPG